MFVELIACGVYGLSCWFSEVRCTLTCQLIYFVVWLHFVFTRCTDTERRLTLTWIGPFRQEVTTALLPPSTMSALCSFSSITSLFTKPHPKRTLKCPFAYYHCPQMHHYACVYCNTEAMGGGVGGGTLSVLSLLVNSVKYNSTRHHMIFFSYQFRCHVLIILLVYVKQTSSLTRNAEAQSSPWLLTDHCME